MNSVTPQKVTQALASHTCVIAINFCTKRDVRSKLGLQDEACKLGDACDT